MRALSFSRQTTSTSEAGNGSAGIFVYLLVLSGIISGFLMVTDWIYHTKEAKVQARWEMHLERNRRGLNLIDRGPGEYQVACRPMFSKSCS